MKLHSNPRQGFPMEHDKLILEFKENRKNKDKNNTKPDIRHNYDAIVIRTLILSLESTKFPMPCKRSQPKHMYNADL